MGKTKKATPTKAASNPVTCVVCRRPSRNKQILCQYCKPKLDRITDPKADEFNQQLTAIIRNTKLNCRPGLANKLVSSIKSLKTAKSDQISKRSKLIRAFRDKYRRQEAKKEAETRRGIAHVPNARGAKVSTGA